MTDYKRKLIDYTKGNVTKKSKYEEKYMEILNNVKSQVGIRGRLILFHNPSDTPSMVLHNAAYRVGVCVKISKSDHNSTIYRLSIGNEVIVEGSYGNIVDARSELTKLVLSNLERTCFSVYRKIAYRDTPKIAFSSSSGTACGQIQPNYLSLYGVGTKMMENMGWSGKGLGSQEQGSVDIIEPCVQMHRQGLGTRNIAQKIREILSNYASSSDINAFAFSSEFTKDERAVIHRIAQQMHLHSRSYGSGTNRMVVIRSKIKDWDLVQSLLEAGGETQQFKLTVPANFNNSV